MVKSLQLTIIASLLCLTGCATSSGPSQPPEGMGLLAGANTRSLRVLIRTIDDGEILWVGQYQLATNAAIAPGQHKVNVMCEFNYSWGSSMNPGNVVIDVQSGKTYDLTGAPSEGGKDCDVEAKVRR